MLGAAYEACMRPPAAELRALGSRLGLGWNDVSQYFRKRRGLDLAPGGADAAPSGMRSSALQRPHRIRTHGGVGSKRGARTRSRTLGRLLFRERGPSPRGLPQGSVVTRCSAQILRCRVLLRCARPIRCSARSGLYPHSVSSFASPPRHGAVRLGLLLTWLWRLQAHARLPRRTSPNHWRVGTKAMPSNRRACLPCARRTAR